MGAGLLFQTIIGIICALGKGLRQAIEALFSNVGYIVVNWIVGTYKMLVLAIALILVILPIAANLYLGPKE